MRHLKYLLMAAFVGIAFVACSDDDVVDDTGKGTIVGDEAWMSISIAPQGGKTRGLHDEKEEEGKANESVINSLRVILFDGFGSDAKVTNVINLASVTAGSAVPAFKVSSSAESVLAIVNPTSQMATVVPGDTYEKVNSVITATVAQVIGDIDNPSNFMMTNASGKLEPQVLPASATTYTKYEDAAPGYLKTTYLELNANDAKNNPLPITVDRVVAKVRVYNKYDNPDTPPATADDIKFVLETASFGWALNVTNKKTFPVSERTYTELEYRMVNSITPASTGFVKSDIWRFGSYRIDPNYNTPGGSTTDNLQPIIADEAASATDEFYRAAYRFYGPDGKDSDGNAVSWNVSSDGNVENPEEGATNPKNNVEYCLENTQDEAGNYYAYTTHALIKGNVYPYSFVDADGSLKLATAGVPFLKIGTSYYTYETLVNNIEVEVTNFINYKTPSSLSLANVFNAYLDYIGEDEVEIQAVIDATSGTTANKAAAVKDAFASTAAAVATYGAATDGTVSYYAGGISYYRIMIKHDDYDGNNFMNKLGEFGVVRNSVYDILISGVNAPGSSVIPQPNPNTPDEESESWLSVEIDINNWTWYTQGAVLE